MDLQKNILILDDDADIKSLYVNELYKSGFNVFPVSEGTRALITAQNEDIDLIILDLMLSGGINGFEVLEKLRKNPKTKEIPVIVLTNLDSEEKTAREIGVDEYLIKTNYTPQEVLKIVDKYLKPKEAALED